MNKVEIGLKKGYVVVGSDCAQDNRRLVSLVNHQLMQLGYMLSEEAFMQMSKSDVADIQGWSRIAVDFYQSYLGDGNSKTLSDLVLTGDLFDTHWSLLSRFWQAQEWEPTQKELVAFTPSKLKMLNYASEKKFRSIFTDLVQVNTALTAMDFETIEWFVEQYKKDLPMPDSIPFKENLCMLAAKGIDVPVKTTTDVLRIAAYMSGLGSDLILPPKKIKVSGWSRTMIDNPAYKEAKFRKFTREEKRFVLSLLEKCAVVSELKTHEGRWLRLFNMLNPQDYKKAFPKSHEAAYILRNQSTNKALKTKPEKNGFKRNARIITWKGKLYRAYKKSFLEGLKLHGERAGELARSLDALLRNNKKHKDDILAAFRSVAQKVSNKVLFEIYTHFGKRLEHYDRSVFIPGARKPVPLPALSPMSVKDVQEIEDSIWAVLYDKFTLLPNLGKVWIDEELKKIPLPTNMKTLSDSLAVVVRGSRSPISKDVKMINAYLYWTAGRDLDLAMTFLNPTTGERKICAYHGLAPFRGVVHSGDIIPHVTGKYAEYIGIDIDATNALGYRYGLMTTHNYNGGGLDSLGAMVGLQEVFELERSKIWLPTNAIAATRLTTPASTIALLLFDFQEREWILVDCDLNQVPLANGKELTKYIMSLTTVPKVSVYSLLKMHADARGALVADVADADVVFNFEDFSTSYTEIIKYML